MKRFNGEVFYSTIKGKLTARAEFYDEKQGKRRQVWRTVTGTKKDAKERVITAVEKILNDKSTSPRDYTFSEYAEYYKKNHAVPAKFVEGIKTEGKKTYKTIRCDIDRLAEFFKNKKIKDIKRDDILKFRKTRLETPVRTIYFEKVLITDEERATLNVNIRKKFKKVRKEKLTPRAVASVNHELRTFSAMMHVAYDNEWLDRLPRMKGVILGAIEKSRERIPTLEEFERLLDEAGKEPRRWHIRALMFLISEVGARPIECYNMKWEKETDDDSFVDMENKTVTLVSDKGKERRIDKLFMTDRLFQELIKLPRQNNYVLGKIKSAKRAWNNITSKTGVDVDLYSLRHFYSVRVDALPISDTLKMRLTRHTVRKTADKYRHYSDDDLKTVAEQLGDILESEIID